MLQVDICPFASDALEDAMRLAQTKSLNSYTFSDCLNFLNYVWSDIYSQICTIDSGYYSKTVKLTSKLTKLPKFVKNSIRVYSAQRPDDGSFRTIYRQASDTEYRQSGMYHISGTDLYCVDAETRNVWLEYCPQPSQIFFTHHNRDPKICGDDVAVERNSVYNLWQLIGSNLLNVSDKSTTQAQIAASTKWLLRHRNTAAQIPDDDITEYIIREPDENGKWQLKYISCDFPYIFCSYQHNITGEWKSGFFNRQMEWTDYNPFEWTGRNDNVEYINCHYNDKTGLGVVVRDWNDLDKTLLNIDSLPTTGDTVIYVHNYFEYKFNNGKVHKFTKGYWFNRVDNDFNYTEVPLVASFPSEPDIGDTVQYNGKIYKYTGTNWTVITSILEVAQEQTSPKIKELGWTPDSKLVYPAPEVYRYLVARLAEKFAALNESNIMGVQSELIDARFAFQAFLKKDKSAWEHIRNVNPANIGDWL